MHTELHCASTKSRLYNIFKITLNIFAHFFLLKYSPLLLFCLFVTDVSAHSRGMFECIFKFPVVKPGVCVCVCNTWCVSLRKFQFVACQTSSRGWGKEKHKPLSLSLLRLTWRWLAPLPLLFFSLPFFSTIYTLHHQSKRRRKLCPFIRLNDVTAQEQHAVPAVVVDIYESTTCAHQSTKK